jgi:hypothetical protein
MVEPGNIADRNSRGEDTQVLKSILLCSLSTRDLRLGGYRDMLVR